MAANSLRLRCFEECPCRCHYRTVVRSPRLLSECLGDFFLGCSSLPWSLSSYVQCDEQSCRRSRSSMMELRYFLPSWFSYAVARFSVNFSLRLLPLNVCLQTRQTIPYDSPILVCTQDGDIEGMRRLLRLGAASLNDVDPYGLGLLYVSMPSPKAMDSVAYAHPNHYSMLPITVGGAQGRRQPQQRASFSWIWEPTPTGKMKLESKCHLSTKCHVHSLLISSIAH